MKILIESIPQEKQRYETVGDWRFTIDTKETNLLISVSETGDDKMNALIAIHELIEALLCRFNDPEITTEMVDAFDMSNHLLDEPGDSFQAPYHKQHKFAELIEKLIAIQLSVDWKEYENKIYSL